MSLRVLLVSNYPPDQQKSMTSFAKMMCHLLVESNVCVEVINPSRFLLPKGVSPQRLWKWIGYVDKFIIFPFLLRRRAGFFDCIHICDHSNAMYVLALKSIPTVVTCHDVLAIEAARNLLPGTSIGFMGKIFQRLIFRGLNKASAVVCDSFYTKAHLEELGWNGKSISVSLLSLNNNFCAVDAHTISQWVNQVGLPSGSKYLIHVGSDLPRKNRIFAVKTFKLIRELCPEVDYKLLFVGPNASSEMNQFILSNQLAESVFFVQDASHEMLSALYTGAVCLLFPSLQEGFGWPIIEAQACGCPVFTSNLLPMTEVGGTGAIYIDPLDEVSAAQCVVEKISELGTLRLGGFENLKRFSESNLLNSYKSAYSNAMRGF